MTPNVVEPGTRLVDRYRLEKHLGEAAGTSYWRAHDELLDRSVGICLLSADDDRAARVLSAARQAAAVTDPRFLRVLDASEVDGPLGRVLYVVNEWVRATSLSDLLADGPLPPPEAGELGLEIAEALDAAHQAGLAHLCLQPEHVLRTSHGQVKIVGLAVEAAVRGLEPADDRDAASRDTVGAAAVAYAALTARWPGAEPTGLAAAPRDGAAVCSPRQVRAGIPHDLDEIVSRALDVPGAGGDPLRTPAALAAALGKAHVTSRIPAVLPTADPAGSDSFPPGRLAPYDEQGGRRSSVLARLAWGAVVLLLCVGLALGVSQLFLAARDGDASSPGASGSTTGSPQPTGGPIAIQSVASFDPEGDGKENDDRVARTIDGDQSTAWTTKTYFDQFGPAGLKQGVGLLLDLGSVQRVGSVSVRTAGGATGLELRAAKTSGTTTDDFALVASQSNVDGPADLVPREPLRARYLLVWLTSLPAVGADFRGSISEITVSS